MSRDLPLRSAYLSSEISSLPHFGNSLLDLYMRKPADAASFLRKTATGASSCGQEHCYQPGRPGKHRFKRSVCFHEQALEVSAAADRHGCCLCSFAATVGKPLGQCTT